MNDLNMREFRKPDFLIIGAMKAGTTSMADALAIHPDIHITAEKETHFFDRSNRTEAEYQQYLSTFATEKQVSGSVPQQYTKTHVPRIAATPARLKQQFPDVKLIYIVRDPIARMISHFQEHFSEDQCGRGILDFGRERAENAMLWEHWLMTSSYGFQLNSYLDHFRADQIHVLRFEDLILNSATTMDEVCQFLGVRTGVIKELPKSNDSSKKTFLKNHAQTLMSNKTEFASKWRARIHRASKQHDWLGAMMLQPAFKPQLSSAMRQELEDYFATDAERIAEPSMLDSIAYYRHEVEVEPENLGYAVIERILAQHQLANSLA